MYACILHATLYMPPGMHAVTRPSKARPMRGGICRQALHVLNRGLAAGLPVERNANQEATPCGLHPMSHQIPALAPKLQSSLIMLGPRKAAVRRPQHGYSIKGYIKRAALAAQ